MKKTLLALLLIVAMLIPQGVFAEDVETVNQNETENYEAENEEPGPAGIFTGWVDNKYYFDENGQMAKGWHKIDGKEYFFNKQTGAKLVGLHKIGTGKSALVCTFSKDGVLVRKLKASKKSICLTFDDGPSAYTAKVVNTLAKYDAKATFFMVGNRCKLYKSACKKVANTGNQIGSHTYSHAWLNGLDAKGIQRQMKKGKKAIKNNSGTAAAICRTPGGQNSKLIRNNVNMPIIAWSVDTRDWEHHNAQKTLSAVKKGAKDGAIVLMHDLHKTTADAVPSVCKYLKKQGYQMVTIEEMALLKGVKLKAGQVYYNF